MDLTFKVLNLQLDQYKRNSTVENGQDSNSHCLVSLENEITPFEEPKDTDIDEIKVLISWSHKYTHKVLNLFPISYVLCVLCRF